MSVNNDKPLIPLARALPIDRASVCFLQIIGLAVAYFIAGKLSYFSIIPVDSTSIIMPASGVALAGMLIYGYRIWPAIFLGAVLVNGFIPAVSSGLSENAISVLIIFVISAGAMLQAALGAYLIRRFVDFPEAYFKGNKVLLFFFYGGVVSTLCHSTFSVAILVVTGQLLLTHTFSSWAAGWGADFLGVLIFTPLFLVWLMPTSNLLFNRRFTITLPIVMLCILTVFAVFMAKQYSNEKIKAEFIEQSLTLKLSLESAMAAQLNTLYSLERFFASSEQVDRAEFHSFVGHYLAEMPSIQALGWNPMIRDSERADFERSIQLQGYSDFKITEQGAQQKMMPALQRAAYLPIVFIEPKEKNQAFLGFDVSSKESRRITYDKARDSGDIAMSAPVVLIQGDKGIVAVMPLYEHGTSPQSQVERRYAIVGYVYLTFRTSGIVSQTLTTRKTEGLSYWLFDESTSVGPKLITTNVSETADIILKGWHGHFSEKMAAMKYHISFPVGDRLWRLDIVPTNAWLIEYGNYYAELVLILGLFLTGIAGAFIWVVSGRESVIYGFLQERLVSLEKIEEKMQSERAIKDLLQSKQDMLNKLLFQIPGMVYQFKCSLEGQYSFPFVSEGVNEVYELSVDQVLAAAEPILERLHPDDYTKIIESIDLSMKTLQPWGAEFRVVLPNKGVRWLSGVSRPEKLSDGSILWHGFTQDITDRVQDEEELRREKQKFQRLFESSPIGMALIDSQTNLFLEVNDKILQDTGYSKDEFLNLSFWDVIPVEYQNQEAQQIRELDQKIRFSSNEKEYLRKDGSRYPIDISGFKFVYHNGKEVTWIFIEDISKRKQLAALVIEQALDKVQIAHLDRQRSLGLMSASLGHELKQPLTAILTNAQVAKRGIQKELLSMPLVEAFLDKIIYNVQRTSHVIERIRGFIDPSVLEKTVVDIGQLVVNTAALLEQDFMLHNIAIQFSIEDDRMKVLADEVLLTQVFVNIYRNAMEALVLQKIKIIYVSVTEKDSRIIIVVRDTGLGIAKEVLKFINEPFYTTKVGGLGVGLSISRSIIEQYEGQLIIANAKEGGARLEIQLPQFLNDTCSHCTGCDES